MELFLRMKVGGNLRLSESFARIGFPTVTGPPRSAKVACLNRASW